MLRLNDILHALVGLLILTANSFAATNVEHEHAGRVHKHALPKTQQIKHRHGNGAIGKPVNSVIKSKSNKAQANDLPSFYNRLPVHQKQRIQESLAWVIDTQAPLDLPFNQASYALIKRWQKSAGFPVDGKLSQTQMKRLDFQTETARSAVDWTTFRAKDNSFQIGVPNRFAQKRSFNEAGGVEFSSFNKHYTLSLVSNKDDAIGSFLEFERNSIDSMYQQMLLQFKSEGFRNIRQRKSAEGFILSGVQNGEILYVNFTKNGAGHVGYLLSLPYTKSTRAGTNTLLAATALSFKVNDKSSLAEAKGKTYKKKLDKRNVPPQVKTRESTPLSAEAIFRKVNQSVWLLRPSNNRNVAQGSAVAIHKHYLLTNCHVMGASTTGKITHKEAKVKNLAVTLFTRDRQNDQCVLKSQAPLPGFVSIRPYKNINIGEKVYTVGAPQGFSLTIAEGLLSSKREQGKRRLLQTSAPISQGSSGGGLFDGSGNLLGITTLMSAQGQNLNFAIPAEEYWSP